MGQVRQDFNVMKINFHNKKACKFGKELCQRQKANIPGFYQIVLR